MTAATMRPIRSGAGTIFVPEDGGHRHTFLINSHPAVLDGFVSEYRAELAKLHLFGAEHCEPNSGEQDFTGRVLILSPDTLRESYWQPENQLWLALSGFGCSASRPWTLGTLHLLGRRRDHEVEPLRVRRHYP